MSITPLIRSLRLRLLFSVSQYCAYAAAFRLRYDMPRQRVDFAMLIDTTAMALAHTLPR